MAIPYSNSLEITLPSDEATCVTLPAPMRGVMTRLIIKQVSGTLEGFEARLYDRQDACSDVAESSFSFDADDPNELLESELHQLLETIVVAASGAVAELYERTVAYENRDEADTVALRRKSALYLQVTPTGSNNKAFQIAYTCSVDMG